MGSLIGGITSGFGGKSGGSPFTSSVGGGGGLSSADIGLIEQSLGLGTEAIHNRYAQLGLGVPDGDPATAAASGQSLNYAGPSTMEMQDIGGLGNVAQAAMGSLQNTNATNPAIPGSVANQGQNITNLGQLATQLGQGDTLNQGGGLNTSPGVSTG
jgi:hypothetical protein